MSEIKVLLVDDDHVDLKAHQRYLTKNKDTDFNVEQADNIESAIYKLGGKNYDCVLLDYNMPGYTGLELLDKIREIDPDHDIPIIFLTGQGDEKIAVNAFKKGVYDYLIKNDINAKILSDAILKVVDTRQARLKNLKEQQNTKMLAYFDPLTRLLNRRGFNQHASKIASYSKRHNIDTAILYIDIDNLKIINDTFGHEVGDILIKSIASNLSSIVRNEDLVARFGGDEFVVFVSKIKHGEDIVAITNKIITKISNIKIDIDPSIQNSCSIGVNIYNHSLSLSDNIQKADKKLYQAKKSGKNKFII